ncbi:MAG: BatD family protein [Verrucomicrobiota bacterium]|nr:BatD family protein [Verrucomicrobiota bacterium]
MRYKKATFLTLLCLLNAVSSLGEITINARFNPAVIALGDRAQYIVEIIDSSDKSMPQPESVQPLPIPIVQELNLVNGRISNSSQTNYINGKGQFSNTQSIIYEVRINRTGNYTIPEYKFSYKGEMQTVESASLSVLERGADAAPTQGEMLLLDADLPESMYIGQSYETTLNLYVESSISLTGISGYEQQADSYAVRELDLNARTESIQMIDSRRYRVLSWPLVVTPIKTGQQPLDFTFTVSVRSPQSRDPFNILSPFGGSLFDNLVGRSEVFDVSSDSLSIDVKSLPKLGQPDSFSGAIGDFNLQVYSDLQSIKVDEPIMLSVEISGRGNFDRIQEPPIEKTSEWRSYSPEVTFQSKNELSLEGTKRFDYVFIARESGQLQLPKIAFSYLDPQTGEYTELISPPIKVEVSPNQEVQNSEISAPVEVLVTNKDDGSLQLTRSLSPEEALLTLAYRQKLPPSNSTSILGSLNYYLGNVLAFIILLLLGLHLRKCCKLNSDPVYALQHAANKEFKKVFSASLKCKDMKDFYQQALLALRLAATRKTGISFRNATGNQIKELITDKSIQEISNEFFSTADAIHFSKTQTIGDLKNAREKLKKI